MVPQIEGRNVSSNRVSHRQVFLEPCLIIHADMVYLVYVEDDSILIGRDRTKIDAMIKIWLLT